MDRMMFRGVHPAGLLRQVLEELKPMSDRAEGTMRIVVACLLVWLVMLTFRNPMADIGVFMVFVFMQRSTLMTRYVAVVTIVALTLCSLCIIGIAEVSWNIPWLRILLWGGLFWSSYYMMSRFERFGAVFVITVSFGAVFCFEFDQTGSRPNVIVSQLGWLWCAIGLAMIFTMACQYLFSAPTVLDLLRIQARRTLNLARTHCIERARGGLSPMTLGMVGVARDQVGMLRKFGLLTTMQSENCRRIFTAVQAIDRVALERREGGTNDQSGEENDPDSKVWLRVASHLRHLERRLLYGEGTKNDSGERGERLSEEGIVDPALAGAVRGLLDAEACLDDPERKVMIGAPVVRAEERTVTSTKDFSDSEFATRATVATMACYMFASMTDWSGIHTCMITCAVTAMNNVDSQIFKQRLRIIGAATGGLMGFLAMFIIPHADNLTGVMLIAAAGIAASAWVFMGREKYSYAGMQMGLAFVMLVMQEPHATTGFTVIRDRLVGILIGLMAMRYAFIWWTPKYIRSAEPAPAERFSPV